LLDTLAGGPPNTLSYDKTTNKITLDHRLTEDQEFSLARNKEALKAAIVTGEQQSLAVAPREPQGRPPLEKAEAAPENGAGIKNYDDKVAIAQIMLETLHRSKGPLNIKKSINEHGHGIDGVLGEFTPGRHHDSAEALQQFTQRSGVANPPNNKLDDTTFD